LLESEIRAALARKNAPLAAEQPKAVVEEKIKILVVEDSVFIRETTLAILTEDGYSVKGAATVAEALRFIENDSFNMVISDLTLEQGSGLELVDPVRKKDPSTIFLIMTGAGTMETALEAIKKGVDEYILKPISPPELSHKVETYLDRQRMKKEKEALVGQLEKLNAKLLELVKVDELTGVFNRRYLFEQMHIEVQKAVRQRRRITLMMCDVDGFKKFNDTHGHLEGDELLKKISGLLRLSTRQYVDQVFRYGGDEFAILIPEIDLETAKMIGGRIVSNISKHLKDKGISMSVGVANVASEDIHSLNEFVQEADGKLYEVKKQGGNKMIF
jgi:two-component system cell cycle response regulator